MAVCCFCNFGVINMNHHSLAATTIASFHFCPKFTGYKHSQKLLGGWFGSGWGLVSHRNEQQRLWKLVAAAELSRPYSHNFSLDSKTFQSTDTSDLGWIGPVPGDIAEVEAYCRIFRAAENLHVTLMDSLCNPETGECMVSYDNSSEVLEDKIVSVLGCMISLLNKGREEVLSERSSMTASFRVTEAVEDNLPPLAVFRSEIKRICESLHVALVNYLTPDDDRSCDIWRKLQRLKNLCYDLGFPRGDDSPEHMLLANWAPVYFSSSRDERTSTGSAVAFWKGGQVTEEGLDWLMQKSFKTIVDLRAENVRDDFYQAALDGAIESGAVKLVKFPVDIGTAPSMEQVEKFAALVSDSSRRPIYLHSREGVRRTSAMISRWRHYMTRCEVQTSGNPRDFSGTLMQATNGNVSKTVDKGKQFKEDDELLKISSKKINTPNGVLHEQLFLVINKHNQNGNGASNGSVPGQAACVSKVDSTGSETDYTFSPDVNPLKSQLPPCNIFSRKEMSSFYKGRNISPRTYLDSWRRPQTSPVSREAYSFEGQDYKKNDMGLVSAPVEVEKSNGPCYSKNQFYSPQRTSPVNGAIGHDSSDLAVSANLDDLGKGSNTENEGLTGTELSGSIIADSTSQIDESETFRQGQMNRSSPSVASADNGIELVEENMCASATGVVRIQSRKKAEMFVVRTDGFSCTREKVTESSLAFTHPSTQQQMLLWKSVPKTVLLLKKLGQELMEETKEVASFLHHREKMNVLVEPDVHDILARIPGFGFVHTFYSHDTSDLHEKVDFVACLGGDGVILHASNIFRGPVPPVVSFNLGSLGFLTSHAFDDYKLDLRRIVHGNNTREGVYITLRMRLHCEIFRNGKAVPGKVFDVLNEVVVDRGSNPYLSKIECYEHDRLITKVQGDGVIVATPTGSTAYSSAAGGSMVHPNVPCVLFTPICPHSLSFRPVILPDSARLELKIPSDARSNAWVSFDGKRRQQLSMGDSVRICMSQHPLPTVNKLDQTGDWFHSLIRCLSWNERLDQKALPSL